MRQNGEETLGAAHYRVEFCWGRVWGYPSGAGGTKWQGALQHPLPPGRENENKSERMRARARRKISDFGRT